MPIECINHLTDLVKAVNKKERRSLACVVYCHHYVIELRFCHELIEAKGSIIEHVDGLCQTPEIFILDTKEAQHEEATAQPKIEFLEVHGLIQSLVCLWDKQFDNPTSRVSTCKTVEACCNLQSVPTGD